MAYTGEMVQSAERDSLFAGREVSKDLYRQLVNAVSKVGKFEEEVKKTCIHLVRKSAFAGVHPRKEHLLVTVKSAELIRSPRVLKAIRASKNRWYVDVRVAASADIDSELVSWVRNSDDLCA